MRGWGSFVEFKIDFYGSVCTTAFSQKLVLLETHLYLTSKRNIKYILCQEWLYHTYICVTYIFIDFQKIMLNHNCHSIKKVSNKRKRMKAKRINEIRKKEKITEKTSERKIFMQNIWYVQFHIVRLELTFVFAFHTYKNVRAEEKNNRNCVKY